MMMLCGFTSDELFSLRQHMKENGLNLCDVMERSKIAPDEIIQKLKAERDDIDRQIAKLQSQNKGAMK